MQEVKFDNYIELHFYKSGYIPVEQVYDARTLLKGNLVVIMNKDTAHHSLFDKLLNP